MVVLFSARFQSISMETFSVNFDMGTFPARMMSSGRIADSWIIEINCVPDCKVALWEGPQLLLAKVKDADEQDWYISVLILGKNCP